MSTKTNKAIVRTFIDIWNSRAFSRFTEIMAAECCLSVSGARLPCNPAATSVIATRWCAAFPDFRFALADLIAEGDRVVAHLPFAGTQHGPLGDLPAGGGRVTVDEIVIFRIAQGKIAEAWEIYDECGMRRQLGADV